MHAAPPLLNLVVLRSPDIDRAAKFYSALGLLITKHSHGGPEHYTAVVAGFVFEIYPLTPRSGSTTSTRIGFNVDDVDSIVPSVVALGAELISPVKESEWGRRAVVKDLDGHTVELLTPPNRQENFGRC